jgi:hypothetical protein
MKEKTMATKREDIQGLISQTMQGRDIAPNPAPEIDPLKPPPMKQVQIRLQPGDYQTLQRIAYRKGTKAAALIREAVKEIIRREGNA